MSSGLLSRAAVAALVVPSLLALLPAFAEDLVSVREVILPLASATRPGDVVAYGQSTVKKEGDIVVLSASSGEAALARWFPNHLRLKGADFPDSGLRLLVETEGGDGLAVNAAWRSGDSALGTKVSGTLKASSEGRASALLPLPAWIEGQDVSALYLAFPEGKEVHIRKAAIVSPVDLLLDVAAQQDPWKKEPLAFSGRGATPGAEVRIAVRPDAGNAFGSTLDVAATAGADGAFTVARENGDLVPGDYVATVVEAKAPAKKAFPVHFFVFPALADAPLPAVRAEGTQLIADGKSFGFVGVNYSAFLLDFPRKADYREIVRHLVEMKSWGVRVARVPLNMSLIQPAEGLFPDDPRWADAMKVHQLDPEFVRAIDYYVKVAGQMGIYTVLDWHGFPTEPYDYHAGGQPSDLGTKKPGAAIAWLAPSATETIELDDANPRHRKAILTAHTWLASHFKGNPNILSIEVPYNEPHNLFMATEANWRKLTAQAIEAVKLGDPDRLTFTMPSAYGHDNLSASATWLPPDRASGVAPHFYLANGPVPTRPDAAQSKQPYLARNAAMSFGYAQASVFMPFSGIECPIYNGESGEYGNADFLPTEKFPDRAEWVIEAQMVQAYAAGWSGVLEWTLWLDKGDFMPYRALYAHVFKRYAPVFASGTLDRSKAEVAFVQSPGAVPPQNGMNYACVPFAKLVLALHLPGVHYFTDAQLLYRFRASVPTGLEQVVEGGSLSRYKAIVADRRNLDPRAIELITASKVPVLWADDAEKVTAAQLATFLEKSGARADAKTPEGLQIVEGPQYLLVYNRADKETKDRAYPLVRRSGTFVLLDEAGKAVFKGNAAALARDGVDVALPRWTASIYRIAD